MSLFQTFQFEKSELDLSQNNTGSDARYGDKSELDLSQFSKRFAAENGFSTANEKSCAEQSLSKKADPTGTLNLTKKVSLSDKHNCVR